MLAGELTAAFVARIAAIGRVADPFIDIDLVAATATCHTAMQERKETMGEKPAATVAAAATPTARAVAVARFGRAPIGA
jgi:hypothetical protein